MDYSTLSEKVRTQAIKVQKADVAFKVAQNNSNEDYHSAKQKLQKNLNALNEKMNHYLAEQYGIQEKGKAYDQWLDSHQPFHWVAEFYGIIQQGGFDVVIGNPPYVEYSEVRGKYTIRDYKTESCGNLYACFMERSSALIDSQSFSGMIVPISVNSTDKYQPVQKLLLQKSSLHISSFSHLVGKLFDISNPRLCIVLYCNKKSIPSNRRMWTTCYNKIGSGTYRNTIFQRIQYVDTSRFQKSFLNKLGAQIEEGILMKISQKKTLLFAKNSDKKMYFSRKFGWYIPVTDFIPYVCDDNDTIRFPAELKTIFLKLKMIYTEESPL